MLDPLNRRRFLGVTGATLPALTVGQDGRATAGRRGTAVLRARSHLAGQATATLTVTVG